MKILIPMAGEGIRFVKRGYFSPKPLILINGKPMIERVIESLNLNHQYIFLVRSTSFELQRLLSKITEDKATIVDVVHCTEGAACTALLAKEFIDNDEELLIANSDQIVHYDVDKFNKMKGNTGLDGIIFTFTATDPKWSFVQADKDGRIYNVEEKNPISNIATCGVYWYRKGSDFVSAAETMIENKIKTNNEFYIAPAYNEMIKIGKNISAFFVDEMHGVGTPEDLEAYCANHFS